MLHPYTVHRSKCLCPGMEAITVEDKSDLSLCAPCSHPDVQSAQTCAKAGERAECTVHSSGVSISTLSHRQRHLQRTTSSGALTFSDEVLDQIGTSCTEPLGQ
ncbi:hypothetical protein O181_004501 [Austropuccinia psidii MF-1]|uniref:Uncharacterized protein n=1 Tax=Austropuccinia psidii MF-1 TaxID=1389203 RepID=A0A9Q3GF30_9BASI|nr:hypothetical protein [Austropuccinia psidii MF-1]